MTKSTKIPAQRLYSLIEQLTTAETDVAKKLAPDGVNGVQWVEGGDLATFTDYATNVANPAYLEGRVFYDNEKNALSYYNDESDTTVNLAQEQIVKVSNNSGVAISNGDAVSISGASGGFPNVVRALADNSSNANIIGVATHDIPDNDTGYVTTFGSVGDVDTSSYTAGDILYLSATINGGLTNLEQPVLSPVAIVLTSDLLGTLFVKPRGVLNPIGIGQVLGVGKTQTLTTTPQSITAFNNTSNFTKNTIINQTGADPYTAEILPATTGASGFYRVSFNVTIQTASNVIHTFEMYINGIASGLLGKIDLSNNNIDSGSTAISVITPAVVSETDDIEFLGYVDSGTSSVTYETAVFSIERIGTN